MFNGTAKLAAITALGLTLAACDQDWKIPGFEGPPNGTDAGSDAPTEPVDADPTDPTPPSGDIADPGTEPDTGEETGTDPGPSDSQGTEPEISEPTDPESTPIDGTQIDPADPVEPIDPDGTETPDPDPTEPGEPVESDDLDPEDGTDADTTTTDNNSEDPGPDAPAPAPVETTFEFHAPGALIAGSGVGARDDVVYAPEMVFPINNAPAYPQSMVWGFGGGIGGGDECDSRNYEYPWRDNFCEKRSSNYSTRYCPVARVHLGQDIRVGTAAACNEMRRTYRTNPAGITKYKVVAAEDGVISNIGRYTVNVRAGDTIYRYLHMNMRALQVSLGEAVTAGQHLGYVSKDFGGTPTTFHLHFEIKQNTPETGWEFVPPYTSLVKSYERREGGPGERLEETVAIASDPLPIPEGFVITE